jgi:hypothetical protein
VSETVAADTFLLSYPKAGRTWLRALIGNALVAHYGLPAEHLLDTAALTRAAGLPIAVFRHDGSALRARKPWQKMRTDRSSYRGSAVVLLARGVHDNLVSAYFQATRRWTYKGTISAFIRDDRYGVEKLLTFYRIWFMNRHVPARFALLRYEDLHRDTYGSLARVLEFLGADVPEVTISEAVERCTFENMRRAETEGLFEDEALRPRRPDDPDTYKIRRGEVGSFVEYLSPEDIAYIDAAVHARGCEFTNLA